MSKDPNAPATVATVDRIEAKLDRLIETVGDFASSTDRRFDRLHDDIDQVLTVLDNVNQRLTTDVQNHTRRIERLEVKAGLAV
jgi:ABC-type transporter Mla subunit MlaD